MLGCIRTTETNSKFFIKRTTSLFLILVIVNQLLIQTKYFTILRLRKTDGRDVYPTILLDTPLKYNLFYSFLEPRHIGAAKQLGVTDIIMKGIGPSCQISLPPNKSFL